MCVNNLPRVALDSREDGIRTRDLLIARPESQPLGHRATHHCSPKKVVQLLGGYGSGIPNMCLIYTHRHLRVMW